MNTERVAYIKALQEINALIVEKKRIAGEHGHCGDLGRGDERRVSWSRAEASEQEADDLAATLRQASSRWPWPLLREPSVPSTSNDEPYGSYDCARCFHKGTDRSLAPQTCQRCAYPVKKWPY